MKKLLFIALTIASIGAFAQTNRVNDAAIYLRNGEVEEAKKAAEEAVAHPDTKSDPKAWFYYVSVLDTVLRNKGTYGKLIDDNTSTAFFNACIQCIKTDVKKRYDYYCQEQALITSSFENVNKGIAAYDAKEFDKAIKYYQMVIDAIPYDKNEELKRNNLSEKNIYLYMTYSAIQAKDNAKSKVFLQKLMDLNYDDHLIYLQMVNIHLEERDTTAALKVLDNARTKYPSEKDLINQELNIYLAMGKQDILVEKINAALESNPDDVTLTFVRGNVFDNFSSENTKRFKAQRDSVSIWKRRASAEKAQAKKTIYTTNATTAQKKADELYAKSKEFAAKAEVDYKKVVELNPDYIDAWYNLGALTNNKSTEIVEKINNIPNNITQADYDKRLAPLKKEQTAVLNEALKYFQQALAIAEAKPDDTEEKKKEKNAYMRDILYSIQQVYANLGDEKKTIETMNRRKDYE
jgi:tetratricopeptide (TPR) repeat protein